VKILGKRLLLKKPQRQQNNENSLFITPDTVTNLGVIIGIGEAVEDKRLNVGTKVYHDKRTEKIQFENSETILIYEDSVIGIVKE